MRPPDGPGPPRCPGNEKFGFWFICAHAQPVPSATYLRTGEPAAQSASGGEPHGAGREESTTKPANGWGKHGGGAALENASRFPVSHSRDGGRPPVTFQMSRRTTLGLHSQMA